MAMGPLNPQQLGQLIANENPYGNITDIDLAAVLNSGLGAKFSAVTPYTKMSVEGLPEYWQGFFWPVSTLVNQTAGGTVQHPAPAPQTETIRVSKALRIPYKIGNVDHYLIVGYQGAGGM